MPKTKLNYLPALLLSILAVNPLAASASTDLICTVTAEQFPDFEDGLLESKTVSLTGMQGEAGGDAVIYQNDGFRFRVITGRSLFQDGTTSLMDFYVEAQDLENNRSIRAASASFAGGPHRARLELVTYSHETDWYEGMVIFKCAPSY